MPTPTATSEKSDTLAPTDAGTQNGGSRLRQRRVMRLTRRVLLVLGGLGLAALGVYAFQPQPVLVDVGVVARGRLAVEIRETGVTRVKDRFEISSPVTGTLSRIELEANQAISEGQPLAFLAAAPPPLLDDRTRAEASARLNAARSAQRQAEAQTARARTAKQLADHELERAQALGASLPRQALEQAQFDARLRADELTSAIFASKVATEQVRLAHSTLAQVGNLGAPPLAVVAPVSGHVLRIHRRSAGVVPAGTPLLELGDLSGLEVVVDVLTTDAVRIAPGTAVAIEGWGGEQTLSARVRRVELSAFTRPSALGVEEQRTNVVIVFEQPRRDWAMLGDGYRVEARLVLWNANDVVKVAQGAVFHHGQGWAAFRIEDDVAHLVPVLVGHRAEAEVEVVSGLNPGDRVAVDPGDRVKDGVRVAAR